MASPGNVAYEENDRPRMGAVRKTFQKNALLIKSKLGNTKQVTSNIPDVDWIYGVCNEYDEEGVREVLIHKQNTPDLEKKRGPDILSMNKLAAIRHVSRACQQRPFRHKHLIRLHISRRVGKSPSAKLPSEIDPDYIYGRPGEKNEEMWKVMQHGYGDGWIRMNQEHMHQFWEPKKNKGPINCWTPYWTKKAVDAYRTTIVRMHPEPPRERFIMPRFRNVPKRIDNYNATPLKRDHHELMIL